MKTAKDIMSKPVQTADIQDPANEVYARMKESGIHHLVILDNDHVVGVLSERDVGGPCGDEVRSFRRVGELMSPNPVTIESETAIRLAAATMLASSIGCLPVLEEGKLVGIVTMSDLLELIAAP